MGLDLTGIGSVADLAKGIIDRIFPPNMTDGEKAKAQIELQEIMDKREATVIEAQRSIVVAEMAQGDDFTKRARPTIVYAGLFFIFLVHVLLPTVSFVLGKPMPSLVLPEEFWWAWSGVCGIWVLGRTAEKRGMAGKVGDIAKVITGNK